MEKRRQPEIISGRVNGADGAILAAQGEFSVQRTATGHYTITFPANFRVVAFTAVPSAGGGAAVTYVPLSANSVDAWTATAASTLADISFAFIATGVQT